MVRIEKYVSSRSGVTREIFDEEIVPAGKPVILKQIVPHWPVVKSAATSIDALGQYLKRHDNGTPVETLAGNPQMQGRYFYNADMSGFNYDKGLTSLSSIVDQLLKMADSVPPPMMIYAGSAPSGEAMPGFAAENPMPLLPPDVEPRLWLGNTSRVAAHYDNSRNIACCVAGTRRFTVFPPEQIGNLYLGPLEFTMAGPPASMVDFHAPDYEKYPKFRDAEMAAMVADLEPSDALYMPALWWHHVEAEGPFNLLVNYWWQPPVAGSAFESVMLAMLDLRDQSDVDKTAWKSFFDHYVFGPDAAGVSDHLPEQWRTVTGAKGPERDAMVMEFIMGRLANRMR
jgi:Cupin-like domain